MIRKREKCLVFGLFTAMVMLQVWVADAQGSKRPYPIPVAQAGLKILDDQKVKEHFGIVTVTNTDKAADESFVWYKPWTWF